MVTAFDLLAFDRAKRAALTAGAGPARALRLALAETIPPHVLFIAPRLAVALLTLADRGDLTQAEQDVLLRLTGRELAPLFRLEDHPPGAFANAETAREAIRLWLAPHVVDHHHWHAEQDHAAGASSYMTGHRQRMLGRPAIVEES